jgi:hypothetical protein
MAQKQNLDVLWIQERKPDILFYPKVPARKSSTGSPGGPYRERHLLTSDVQILKF